MQIRKVFLNDTLVYGVTGYLSIVASFFLTPFYTRILSKEDYGLLDLLNVWNSFFALVLPLGLFTAILRLYQDFKNDKILRSEYLGTLFTTVVVVNIIYLLLIILFKTFIINFYYEARISDTLYYLPAISLILTNFFGLFQSLNRTQFQKINYLIAALSAFILLSSLGFFLVVILKIGILGFFIASITSLFVGNIITITKNFNDIKFKFNWRILKESLIYSIPLLFVIIFLRVTFIVDRIIINHFFDLATIGEYSIAIRVVNILQIFVGAFTTAWFPHAMSIINEDNRNTTYKRVFKYFILFSSIIGSLIAIFSNEILLVFAPNYLNVINLIPVLLPTIILTGCSYFVGLGIHIHKKSKLFLISSFIALIVNIATSYLFAKQYGLIGIAYGSLISSLIWITIEQYFNTKLINLRLNIHYLIYIILAYFALGRLSNLINNFEQNILIKVSIKLLIISIILICFIVTNKEIKVFILKAKNKYFS